MKHTSGPWMVSDIPTRDRRISVANNGGAPDIAVVLSRISRTDAETAANARLIAAAPDLLSALNAMLTQFGMDEDEWSKPTFDQARRAVAKATGNA
jgi:hypothetical protein